MTYPDEPQQPHSNPYDKAYPASPFDSEPQPAQQPQPQPNQWQQNPQNQQNQQQAPWQGPPAPPQGASQSGGMSAQPVQPAQPPNTMVYGPSMQQPQQAPYTANPYVPAPAVANPQTKNYLALVAMILGLLTVPSLLFVGWWPPTIAIVTLVVSIVALVRRKSYAEQNRMTGFAITGLVLSSVCITIIAVGFLIYVLVESAEDSSYSNYDSYRSNVLEDA